MSDRKLKIGLVQMAMSNNIESNIDKAKTMITDAASKGAKVVVLPELYKTRYFPQTENSENFDLAEPLDGESQKTFGALAAKLDINIVVPIFERRAVGLYHNTVLVIGPISGQHGIYRKTHIPDDPGFYEKFYFTPGDTGYPTFKVGDITIGVLICWDQWFPETARLMALAGADIIFYPTAIGWLPSEKEDEGAVQLDAWKTVQRGHAIANGCYVAAVNRVGDEPSPAKDRDGGIEFWGSTFLCGPFGAITHEASSDQEEVLIVEIDRDECEQVRRAWPFFRDRRTDLYDPLLKKFID